MRDTELVLRVRGGDQTAFDRLVERNKRQINWIARHYFQKGAAWEDLRQEVLVGLYKAVRDYKPSLRIPFANFALLCMERQAVSAIIAANRRKHSALNDSCCLEGPADRGVDENLMLEKFLSSDLSDPIRHLTNYETLALFAETIADMSPLEREVIVQLAEGFSYEEVAEKTDNPIKAVDNAFQRGRRKIAERLKIKAA